MLRLEPLDRPVHGDPVQARERVVVVRERLARPAQQRPVGLVGDRRDVPGRLGQALRLAAVDGHQVHARADAAVGVGIQVGEEGDRRAVGRDARLLGRPRARRQAPRRAAGARDDVQVGGMQRQPGAVVAPVETVDDAGGRLARLALADEALRARVLGQHHQPASVGMPVERRHATRQHRVAGHRRRLAAVDVDHVQLAGSLAVGQKGQRAAVGREARRAVLAGARGETPDAAAAVGHEADRAAIAVAHRRPPRVRDQLAVRGERHLAERDLLAQVGRIHAMTSTCGVPPCSSSRASTVFSESIETSS